MKKFVAVFLAAVLLCLLQSPALRPAAAAAETEQAAIECAAVPPDAEDGGFFGFLKGIFTRFLSVLKMLCMLLQGRIQRTE